MITLILVQCPDNQLQSTRVEYRLWVYDVSYEGRAHGSTRLSYFPFFSVIHATIERRGPAPKDRPSPRSSRNRKVTQAMPVKSRSLRCLEQWQEAALD